MPLHTDGQESEKSREVRQFARWLAEVTGLPICFYDERFTTREAGYLLEEAQLTKKKRNSPDHTKRRTLKQGETLALIASEEYDNPAEWRRIADANNISDPRDVKPGTVLTIPPIL